MAGVMRKSLSSLSSSSQQTGGHHLLLRRLYHYSSSRCLQLMLVVTCCIFVYVNFQIRTTLSQQQHAPESSQSSSSSLSHSSRNRVEQSPTTEFHTLPVYKDPAVQVLHWSNGTTAIAAATASALSATQQQRNRKKRIADEGQELFNFEPMFGTYRYVASNTKKTNAAIIQFPASDVEPQPRTNSKSHFNNNHNQVRTAPSASNVAAAAAMGSYIPQDSVVVTRQGYKFNPEDGQRTPNQDRVVVVQKHVGGDEEKKKDVANRYWWLGLFDGHGQYGQEVSQYCATMFVHYLLHNFWTDEHNEHTALPTHQIQAIIHHYFHDINTQMPSSIGTGSGTTGISILRNGQYLYITNVGDSVAFLVRYDPTPPHRSSDTTPKSASNSIQILYRTSPHKPDRPQERQRIEEAGGRVQVCHHPGCSARLIIPVLATTTDGELGGGEIGLAMSRSLGDHDGLAVGLSAEPDTTILDLTHYSSNTDSSHPSKKSEYFVVAVTDGLVDYGRLSEEEVALALAHAFADASPTMTTMTTSHTSTTNTNPQPLRKKHSTGQSTEKAALQLILEASKRWKNDQNGGGYRDDISLVAHKLRL